MFSLSLSLSFYDFRICSQSYLKSLQTIRMKMSKISREHQGRTNSSLGKVSFRLIYWRTITCKWPGKYHLLVRSNLVCVWYYLPWDPSAKFSLCRDTADCYAGYLTFGVWGLPRFLSSTRDYPSISRCIIYPGPIKPSNFRKGEKPRRNNAEETFVRYPAALSLPLPSDNKK